MTLDDPTPRRECSPLGFEARTTPRGFAAFIIVLAQVPLIILIGLLDHWTMNRLSLALLYQVPVALAAWRGGFACGVLIALAATGTWHLVDSLQDTTQPAIAAIWNGVVRFAIFAMTCSLLSRLRLSLFHERALARTDALTGAANGRTFYESVYAAVERSLRNASPLTLAYLDLDNFKQVNDRYGHSLGDETLRRLTIAIHRNIRAVDVLARLGGDEFALLLPDTGADDALTLLNRLHQLLRGEVMANSDELTLSIGAATFLRPTRDVDLMVRRTDALMYRAKKTGKNRLEHELVVGEEKCPSAGWERRAVARLVCGGDVRVRAEWLDHAVDELARIVDISSVGIGLSLQQELPAETLLAIEPLHDCGVTTILARVVWCAQQMNAWHHGCILATPLEEAELQRWLRGVSDADGAPKAPVLVPEVGVFLEKF